MSRPAPRPRTGTRGVPRAEREAQILRAGCDLFGELSHAGVSVAAVAARADVSKALVLSYFGTKDQLFLACAGDVAARLLTPITLAVEHSPPGLGMALATVQAVTDTLADHPRDWQVVQDPTVGADTPLGAALARSTAVLVALGRRGVLAALGPGADELDVELLHQLWDEVLGATMRWWAEHPDEPPAVVTDRLTRIATRLFDTAG